MSKLNNTVKTNYQTTSHKNFMNGNSWDISDNFKKLLIVGASSFFRASIKASRYVLSVPFMSQS